MAAEESMPWPENARLGDCSCTNRPHLDRRPLHGTPHQSREEAMRSCARIRIQNRALDGHSQWRSPCHPPAGESDLRSPLQYAETRSPKVTRSRDSAELRAEQELATALCLSGPRTKTPCVIVIERLYDKLPWQLASKQGESNSGSRHA